MPSHVAGATVHYGLDPAMICPTMPLYPDELNIFYACFNSNNTIQGVRYPTETEDWVISLSEADMSKVFHLVNTHKVAGPDGILGRSQSMHISAGKYILYIVIFNLSLSQSVIPTF